MRVAIIGAGAMGRAISAGAHASDKDQWSFAFFDPNEAFANQAAQAVDGEVCDSAEDAISAAALTILAVKPQVQSVVIRDLKRTDSCFVSIAAGRTLASIADDFAAIGADQVATVRIMPNVNAMVAQAVSAICGNQHCSADQIQSVTKLFDSVGSTMELPEHLFAAFAALAGCSPAWFFQVVESLARAGVKHGLSKSQALQAALGSMSGSAASLKKALADGGSPTLMIDQVCSPGGTTIAGLLAAEEHGLSPSLVAAVDAAVARDLELGA